MTDNEIIKALECCGAEYRVCRICPFESHCYDRGESLSNYALDLINRQKAENNDLFYKLQGVMLSVDKWLEGDELKQDEVNRAAKMRERTLQIMEQQRSEIDDLERIVGLKNKRKYYRKFVDEVLRKGLKSEAIKEFAERLKNAMHEKFRNMECPYEYITEKDIDNLVKEMVGE